MIYTETRLGEDGLQYILVRKGNKTLFTVVLYVEVNLQTHLELVRKLEKVGATL